MPSYRKLPVTIKAFRLGHDDPEEWYLEAVILGDVVFVDDEAGARIVTLEGAMHANPGDWIIKGVNGEIYPCKHEIFVKTYEAVT